MKVELVLCFILGVVWGEVLKGNKIEVGDSNFEKSKLLDEDISNNLESGIRRGSSDDIISANIDDYIDNLVENLVEYIEGNGYDNLTLPDEEGIKLKPTGKLNLLEGSMSGLISMERYEDAVVTYDSTTKQLSFEMILRFTEIGFIYKYHSKILFVSSTGHLHGKIEKVKTRVNLGFDFTSYQAFVSHVDVKETGTINIWLSGNSGIDWLTNSVIKVVTTLLHPIILNVVTGAIKGPIDVLNKALNEALNEALHPSTF